MPHKIPLNQPAMDILYKMQAARKEREQSGIKSDFVFAHGRAFTGAGAHEGKPLSDTTVRDLIWQRFADRPENITMHGFRSSFSTWANDQGCYSDKAIEVSLSHTVDNQTARRYNESHRLPALMCPVEVRAIRPTVPSS